MRSSRNILAVAVVAVALCSDRTVAASTAAHRPSGETLTRQIVRKLQRQFQQIVPAVDPLRLRDERPVAPAARITADQSLAIQLSLPIALLPIPPPIA